MEAKTDIILFVDDSFSIRIASTKKGAEAQVLGEELVSKLAPLLKDGVKLKSFIGTSRFAV